MDEHEDFPAAHSMDSCWFAVDENGEVGYFETGEGGAVPAVGDFALGGEAGGDSGYDPLDLLVSVLYARAERDERLRAILPEERELLLDSWADPIDLLPAVGVWTYECSESWAVPYTRIAKVPRPVRIDDLDENTRLAIGGGKLPMIFADSPLVAPGDHVPCDAWSRIWMGCDGAIHPCATTEPDEAEALIAELGDEAAPQRERVQEALQEGQEVPDVPEGDDFYALIEEWVGATLEQQAARRAESARSDANKPGLFAWLGKLFGRKD